MKPDRPASPEIPGFCSCSIVFCRSPTGSTRILPDSPAQKAQVFLIAVINSRGQTCRTIAQAPFHVQTRPDFPKIRPFEKQAPRSWPGIADSGHKNLEFLPGTSPGGGVSLSDDLVGDHPKAPPAALARRRYLWQKSPEKISRNGKRPVG